MSYLRNFRIGAVGSKSLGLALTYARLQNPNVSINTFWNTNNATHNIHCDGFMHVDLHLTFGLGINLVRFEVCEQVS